MQMERSPSSPIQNTALREHILSELLKAYHVSRIHRSNGVPSCMRSRHKPHRNMTNYAMAIVGQSTVRQEHIEAGTRCTQLKRVHHFGFTTG